MAVPIAPERSEAHGRWAISRAGSETVVAIQRRHEEAECDGTGAATAWLSSAPPSRSRFLNTSDIPNRPIIAGMKLMPW